jgi:UDP-N-acetyl-D-mannosaminuronate dehydrogenase
MTADRGSAESPAHQLESRIRARTARVVIIGMGYVGLPLVKTFAWGGYSVTGFDVNEGRVAKLQAGESYIGHIPSIRISEMRHHDIHLDSQPLTEDFLSSQDCVVIVTDHTSYDFGWIVKHSRMIVDTRNATAGLSGRVIKA